MAQDIIINVMAFAIVILSALSFLSGYCFGKADGSKQANNMWKKHIDKYIDPYIKSLNQLVHFYKEHSYMNKINN